MKSITPMTVTMTLLLSGCAQYTYLGRMDAKDSSDRNREIVAYWTKTERALWFDTVAGGVRVLTECSTNTLVFEEKPNGIIFQRRPSDIPVNREIDLGAPCGSVINANRISDLNIGPLDLTVYCRPDSSDEFLDASAANYLQARDEPYRFEIERKRTSEILGRVPKAQPCRD